MATKTPVKATFSGSDVTGLAEYQTGDFIGLSHGGLGASLSIGTAGQVLKVNSGASALEFGSVSGGSADFGEVGEHILPSADDTYDLGSASKQWRNIYTGDLHLSNESKAEGNVVDGTTGNWTIQEGSEELYILNNKSGKKYKFKLEEV
jgi:hypothetical protein